MSLQNIENMKISHLLDEIIILLVSSRQDQQSFSYLQESLDQWISFTYNLKNFRMSKKVMKTLSPGVHYVYFGYGDVPSGRVSIFQILV